MAPKLHIPGGVQSPMIVVLLILLFLFLLLWIVSWDDDGNNSGVLCDNDDDDDDDDDVLGRNDKFQSLIMVNKLNILFSFIFLLPMMITTMLFVQLIPFDFD